MPTTCVFLYDHPDSVYYSGEVLNGKVVLTTDKVKKVRGVFLTIKGSAKVRWTERKSRHNHHTNKTEHYTVEYRGDQQYLHSEQLIEGEMDLQPGIHEYTFTTELPVHMPSSISDEYGEVSYEVELKLDRPWRVDNKYSNCFTVIRPLNLNLDPSYMQPIVDEEQKYFCCFCCKSGPVNSELRTEFSGYAPGQKINFTVLIENEANKDIDGCVVKLMQDISFESESPEHKTNTAVHKIDSISLEGANRFSKKLHKGSIQIPPLPPTTMGSRDIIRVSYYLLAVIDSGWCSSDEELSAGITIGTVPLVASAMNPQSVITVQPTAPVFDFNGDGGDKPPQYGSIVPPSFEEATGMNKPFVNGEVDENRVQDPFVPKYPVYHNFATPSAPGCEKPEKESMQPLGLPAQYPSAPPTYLPYPTEQNPMAPPYPTDAICGMPVPGSSTTNSHNASDNKEGSSLGWKL